MSHDHHTHEISAEQMLLQGAQQHIEMLQLSDKISRKALLKLLPNVGDKVVVTLDPSKKDEVLMNDEGTAPVLSITIVRIEGDTLDLLL